MSAAINALVCEAHGTLPLASLSAATVTSDQMLYRVDQRRGPMQCSVRQCGMFSMRGNVSRFACELALGLGDASVSRFDLTVDLDSFDVGESEASGDVPAASWRSLLADTPIRFRSSAVAARDGVGHVRGLLDFRGITRLQALDLGVSERRSDPITGTDLVDLTLRGRFSQNALGVPLSDVVMATVLDLQLRLAVELES